MRCAGWWPTGSWRTQSARPVAAARSSASESIVSWPTGTPRCARSRVDHQLAAQVHDRLAQTVLQADARLPPEMAPRARDVRAAKVRIVGRQRAELQLRAAACEAQHQLGQLEHRVLDRAADVQRPFDLAVHQAPDRLDGVVDVAEAARLLAVAVYGERLVAQRLHDEVADHAAVARPQARPIAVEHAADA